MVKINLKIAELRKKRNIGQQTLASALGVSFQAVSKWENSVTMPDITLLPYIAEYFNITVDELLGLKPLKDEEYIKRNTHSRENWSGERIGKFKNREYFWNEDYLRFLINNVWNVEGAIDIVEFGCGDGRFGLMIMRLLPKGSTYTGIDHGSLIEGAKNRFKDNEISGEFIASDLYSFKSMRKYDISISQAMLRHMDRPKEVLNIMKESTKKGGKVICIDVNREFESKGMYIESIPYDSICNTFDFQKVWKTELHREGRDYAIGMRLPFYMNEMGLRNIGVRMNDKVTFAESETEEYEKIVEDFREFNGWEDKNGEEECEKVIKLLMNRGLDRVEAEGYLKLNEKISEAINDRDKKVSFLKMFGQVIVWGEK